MTNNRQRAKAAFRGRVKSSVGLLLSAVMVFAQLEPAFAAIVNTVTVTGTAAGKTVTATDTASVTVAPYTPELVVSKTGVYHDSDAMKGLSAGDTITYVITAANRGKQPLTGVTVSDPMIELAYVRGDKANPGTLDPGEVWVHKGVYTITAVDIASNGGGDADIDNTAAVITNELPEQQVSAAVPVDVAGVLAVVNGTVYIDRDGNGRFDGRDKAAGEGYIVELYDANGKLVATTVTDSNGDYSFTTAPGEGYTLRFRLPGGVELGVINDLALPPGSTTVDQNMPVDPSGVIYDSRTRKPLPGVTVSLTDKFGTPLPAACFLRHRQQNQVTGADGDYRFDLLPGADPACPESQTQYRIALTAPSGYLPGVSKALPPSGNILDAARCNIDATPGGSCNVSASANPPVTGGATYFIAIVIGAGSRDVVNNHIPVDPFVGKPGALSKQALETQIMRGDRVGYVIESKGITINPATIIDTIPPGFLYVPGSARVNGAPATPRIEGRNLVFAGLVPEKKQLKLELTLLASAAVPPGVHVNTAELIDERLQLTAGTARAAVTVMPEHVFDCGDIIGRVFEDKNGDGYFNDGEAGLPGVRLATVNGLLVTTDKHGRFHVGCAELPDKAIGSNFVMKLDTRTLPEGYSVTSENPRTVRLTAGKATKLNFGAARQSTVTLDLRNEAFEAGTAVLEASWSEGLGNLIAILSRRRAELHIIYHAATEDRRLIRERLKTIVKAVEAGWKKKGAPYRLTIDTRISGKGP